MVAPDQRSGLLDTTQEHANTFHVTSKLLGRGSNQTKGRATLAARASGTQTQSPSLAAYDTQTGRRLSARATAAPMTDNACTGRPGRKQGTTGQQRRGSNSKLLMHRKWSI